LIYAHEASPKRQIGRELYARAPVGARRRGVPRRTSFVKRQNLRTCCLANDTSRATYDHLQPSLT
jgi:L-amino acid N-acyltransferase YncA